MGVFIPRYSDRLSDLRPWREATRRWEADRLVERLWSRDSSVWGGAADSAAQWLGWLDLPQTMLGRVEEIEQMSAEVLSGGVDDVVLMGMGGSSLAPEMFFSIFGRAPGHPRLWVIDSTHPEAVAALAGRIDPSRTFFVVSSKSGTTVETQSFYRFFWSETGGDPRRFAAITDRGTPLDRLGREKGFGAVLNAPADVGGRFSAFSVFGLVPAALIGVNLRALLATARDMAAEGRSAPLENPAVGLGLSWGAAAVAGMDKLTLHTSQSLPGLGAWMEQLVAESLGKEGRGIVPVFGEPKLPMGSYRSDRLVTVWRVKGDRPPGRPDWEDVSIDLGDRLDLGAELFRSELAVAAAGEVLGVNPFDQPDVEEAKRLASQAMSRPGAVDRADRVAAQTSRARDMIAQTVGGLQPGGYLGLQAYLPPDPAIEDALGRLRGRITEISGVPTTFGYGPRYLHSTGQAHKGGPAGGVFLQIVDRPRTQVRIPGADYDFSKLIAAAAEGDYFALRKAGRRVLRIDVGSDISGGVQAIREALD